MSKCITKFSFVIVPILVVGCNYYIGNNDLIAKASQILEMQPETALALLESIDSSTLNENQYANYVLLHIRAKDKTDQTISSDTAIFKVKDYFIKQKKWKKAALSCFYCGQVYHSQGNIEKAMQVYLDGEQLLLNIENTRKFDSFWDDKNELSIWTSKYIIPITLLICMVVGITHCYRKSLKKEKVMLSIRQHHYDILTERLEAYKRVVLLERLMKTDEKGQLILKSFKTVVGKPSADCLILDWDTLYQSINEMLDGKPDRLKEIYPDLDETEFRICCLLFVKYNIPEIALTLDLKESTVHRRKTEIRSKLRLETRGDIEHFLSQI